MRLSHIKLAGFKSFVDPVQIAVPGDLVGVIGPNGCGKSNVIDAVRWVLGESRATALRGESMQDVIFNGSANRKPVGRASVELIFDNSLGKAAGQWSEYAEIAIKRVLLRDGESSYYINNIHVRRRDIADLFLGTGVGGRGYAIIEQGMISHIIEAKPEELRQFLEEAAGVSRYRERRRETESRLTDTRDNLLRVEDISRELEKQLKRLEAQARVASQYKAMQEELQVAQNLMWMLRKQEAGAQRIRMEQEVHRLETEYERAVTSLHDAGKRLEAKREQHLADSESLHLAQGELYAANAEVARLEQQIRHVQENRQRIAQQITAATSQLEQYGKQQENNADSLGYWRNTLEQASQACEAGRLKLAASNEKLPLAETVFRTCMEQSEHVRRNLLLAEQGRQLEETHHSHADRTLHQLQLRRERLLTEKAALARPDLDALSGLKEAEQKILSDLKDKQGMLEQATGKLPDAASAKQEAADRVQLLEQQLVQAEARLHALQRLQHRLGNNEDLSAWIDRRQLGSQLHLWQGIDIREGWEDALEAVLRERLDSAGFDRLEQAQDWIADTPPGRWTLFETAADTAIMQSGEGISGHESRLPLQYYLTCKDAGMRQVLDEWLNGVFVTESIADGLVQRKQLGTGEILVTREGHIFTRYSLTYYAPDSQLHGVLTRQREITETTARIAGLQDEVAAERSAQEAAEQVWRNLDTTVLQLRQGNVSLQQQQHQLQLQILKLAGEVERSDQRCRQIENELAEIGQQIESETQQKQSASASLEKFQAEIASLQEQVQQAKLAREAAEQALAVQRQVVQDATREMQEAAFHERTCQGKITETENLAGTIAGSIAEIRQNLEALQSEQTGLDDSLLQTGLQEWLTQRRQREIVLAEARTVLESIAADLRTTEQERMKAEQALHPLQESISQARFREQEARMTESQFDGRLKEVAASEEVLLTLAESATPAVLQADIDRLAASITGLGAVNLAALDELQGLQERKTYLDTQCQDLKEAVEMLEKAIQKIDRETREKLMETFDQVNHHLGEMFPAMFGGGQAKLVLSGKEILDSGMQIIAQPPGKKNSSIHLLSGGEKALTALSLVFSLFQLNPAPFCLLDEVDAPLDDANTGRFCALVKKMSQQTKFLFVSHNKVTMEMAQQLIGITMQEKGVSRVVAVDIEEAVRLSSMAATA